MGKLKLRFFSDLSKDCQLEGKLRTRTQAHLNVKGREHQSNFAKIEENITLQNLRAEVTGVSAQVFASIRD